MYGGNMFRLTSDESSQTLGIEVHKLRFYAFERGLLSGSVMHDSTSRDFTVSVQPNYGLMARIADPVKDQSLQSEFNTARAPSISLGAYPTLAVVGHAVTALEGWYKHVLKHKGANHRFLVEDGNEQHLAPDTKASDLRYGEAILQARSIQAFAMLREDQPLDHKTLVGRIMPIFLHALGLKEYGLSHDTSKEGNGEVRFIVQEVGMFAFYKPLQDGGLPYLERYNYRNGDYHCNFSGVVTPNVLKKNVFEWLIDAAKELQTITVDDLDAHLDELSQDVRRSFIMREPLQTPALFQREQGASIHAPSNVVQLGAFRPS